MKIKTSMEIQKQTYYSNENDEEYRNKRWVAVDDMVKLLMIAIKQNEEMLKQCPRLSEHTNGMIQAQKAMIDELEEVSDDK